MLADIFTVLHYQIPFPQNKNSKQDGILIMAQKDVGREVQEASSLTVDEKTFHFTKANRTTLKNPSAMYNFTKLKAKRKEDVIDPFPEQDDLQFFAGQDMKSKGQRKERTTS